jgi:hypothetical protein
MKKCTTFALVFAVAAMIGCLGSLEKYPKEKCVALPNDSVVTAIHDNCISCHKKDFTTRQDICVRKNMIIDAVKTYRMPKMGKLYPRYFKTITEWK